MTLACEDAYSKLVEVVTVADVDNEDCVGKSLLQIWKLRFYHKAKPLFRFWAQGFVKILKFKGKFWSWSLVSILKFDQYFEVKVQASFWSWSLVSIFRLIFCWDFVDDAWSRFWRWNFIKICVRTTEASGQCLTLNVKFMLFNGLKGTIYQGLNDWKCWYCEDSIPWNIRKYIAQPKLERFLLNWIAALKKENPKIILKNYTSPKTNLWNLFHISWVNILTKL